MIVLSTHFKYTKTYLAFFLGVSLLGCSGGSEKTETGNGEQGASQADANSQGSGNGGESTATTGQSGGWQTGADGRPVLVDIPKDVWFDDPLGVVAQPGQIVTQNNPSVQPEGDPPGGADTVEPKQPMPEPMPAAGAVDWGEIISMDILDSEVKESRNVITEALKSVGQYNRSASTIPPRAMTIAALAQIALVHPESALWKNNAATMRELGVKLAYAADGTGKAPFDACTVEFEKLQEIFNGATPALEETPEQEVPFADKADRGPLMQRINVAFEWLNANTPTAAAVEKEKEKTVHETVILKTLLQVTGDHSYYQADEPDYIAHVKEVTDALNVMTTSLETNNFDTFKSSLGIVNRKCTECHLGYKDGQ